MSKNTALKTGLLICAMVLTAAVFVSVKSVISLAGGNFPDAEKYNTGDAEIEDPVKNLNIDWTSGKINIEYHKSNTITIHEESKKSISPDKQLRWYLDKDTLRIRYEKPGIQLFSFSNQEKNLTVTIPENMVFENVSIDVTSGDVNLPLSGKSGKIEVSSTSGNISIEGEDAGSILTESTSGNIHVLMNNVSDFKADATSGAIEAEIKKADNIEVESTSGDVTLSVSALDQLDVDTTSGNVRAALPQTPGFTAEFDTTSGRVEYDLPLEKKKNSYICGDGSGEVEIETTSGNITLLACQD